MAVPLKRRIIWLHIRYKLTKKSHWKNLDRLGIPLQAPENDFYEELVADVVADLRDRVVLQFVNAKIGLTEGKPNPYEVQSAIIEHEVR